ncbi:hypothetical protein DS745_19025 [Anaerobacillus alkaliphilus]|uniref:Uncharacterized protein n=1 Tax=Anaerobacillus alkaliphilus TaxID=1548597 RepID=A0A4Q0VQF3_9BACI|nr:TIGR04086 family membrane protein [Anaerobacillus alkaliphilus]RXI98419.1 hypothetical protein DS745_19025 [Anaerobacillus alkaliphilus]
MEYVILTLIGGGILFLVFYFLPLGQGLLQKTIYVISAIIFSNLFIVSRKIFDLWQAVLILLLVLFLVTYIFTKKQVFAISSTKPEDDRSSEEGFVQSDVVDETVIIQPFVDENPQVENLEDEKLSTLQGESLPVKAYLENLIDEGQVKETNELLENNQIDIVGLQEQIEENDQLLEEIEIRNFNETKDEAEILHEDQLTLIEDDTNQSDDEQSYEFLEARMDVFAQLEDEVSEETETNGPFEVEAKVSNSNENLEEFPVDEQEDGNIRPFTIVDDLELDVLLAEVAATTELSDIEDLVEDFTVPLVKDEVYSLTTSGEDELVETVPYETDFFVDEIQVEEVIRKVEHSQKQLNRKLQETLLDQLAWYKTRVPATEYESLIQEHLHEDLNDLDYYTFASLLRDYYIESKQYQKLALLLMGLNERFSDKPIIQAEILFFLEKFYDKL